MLQLLSLMPSELIVCAFILAILGMMVGLLSKRVVGSILLLLISMPFIGAVTELLYSMLPWWGVVLLTVASIVSLARMVLTILVCRHATDHAGGHFVGHIIVGTARLFGRLILAP